MKIHDVAQGSIEWLTLRSQCVTASEVDNLLTDDGKPRTGQMPLTYLHRKIAERWMGGPLPSFSGGAAEQGSILEADAIPWYSVRYGVDIERPGFYTTDDGSLGCSPDGRLVGHDVGLEAKSPQPTNAVKWLLANECPKEHRLQVQCSMAVTGWKEWEFLSYSRSFPCLVVRVKRDDEMIAAIFAAVAVFRSKMAEAWDKLVAANGGEPVRVASVETVDDPGQPF